MRDFLATPFLLMMYGIGTLYSLISGRQMMMVILHEEDEE